jgi:hypothetical protein
MPITEWLTADVLCYQVQRYSGTAVQRVRGGPSAMTVLDVYVSSHCFGCTEALRLAETAARRFPGLRVRVVDLDRAPEARPEDLVAVPTYILDSQVIALGNPRQRDLFRQIEALLGPAGRKEGRNGAR